MVKKYKPKYSRVVKKVKATKGQKNKWKLYSIYPYSASFLSFMYSNENKKAKYAYREVDVNFNTGELRVNYFKKLDHKPDLIKLKLTKKKLNYWYKLATKNENIIDY